MCRVSYIYENLHCLCIHNTKSLILYLLPVIPSMFMFILFLVELTAFLQHRTETMVVIDPGTEQQVSRFTSLSRPPDYIGFPYIGFPYASNAYSSHLRAFVSWGQPAPDQLQHHAARPALPLRRGGHPGRARHEPHERVQEHREGERAHLCLLAVDRLLESKSVPLCCACAVEPG